MLRGGRQRTVTVHISRKLSALHISSLFNRQDINLDKKNVGYLPALFITSDVMIIDEYLFPWFEM
jgi:hypothetical protein